MNGTTNEISLLPGAIEARDELVKELGGLRWESLTSIQILEPRLMKSSLLLLETYLTGQLMEPGNYKIPVTLVIETIEAVLGRKVM